MSNFCAICAGYHDPSLGCADRVGAALREAGVKRKPTDKKRLETKIKEANRLMVAIIIVVLSLIGLTILLALLLSKPQ